MILFLCLSTMYNIDNSNYLNCIEKCEHKFVYVCGKMYNEFDIKPKK